MGPVIADVDPALSVFISKHELAPAVETAVRLVREHFPGLRDLTAELSADPEIPDYEHVRLRATVAGSMDEILDWDEAFGRAFCEEVPPEDAEHIVVALEVTK